ncbi:MAG: hypothetical protein AAF721_02950 [Myxococcota bacterium]
MTRRPSKSDPLQRALFLVVLGSGGCFSEAPFADGLDTSDDTTGGADPSTSSASGGRTASTADEGPEGGGTGDGGSDDVADSSSGDRGSGDPESGAETGTDTGDAADDTAGDDAWPEACLPAPIRQVCPNPIEDPTSCFAGPTAPVPSPGCGDVEEFRLGVDLGAAGTFLVALMDPQLLGVAPDTTLTMIGTDPSDLPAECVAGLGVGAAPAAIVELGGGPYDIVVTTPTAGGVVFPVVLRPMAELCGVDPACCEAGAIGDCPSTGLQQCVGQFDAYCTDVAWDAQCVVEATVMCGAACPLPG